MKKFKLSKKSLMSFALSAIMLVSMSSMAMLCYAWNHPTTNAFNVTLYADQTKTYSGAKVDPYILFEGRNHGKVKKVWFTPQYTFNSDQSKFVDDTAKEVLIAQIQIIIMANRQWIITNHGGDFVLILMDRVQVERLTVGAGN